MNYITRLIVSKVYSRGGLVKIGENDSEHSNDEGATRLISTFTIRFLGLFAYKTFLVQILSREIEFIFNLCNYIFFSNLLNLDGLKLYTLSIAIPYGSFG